MHYFENLLDDFLVARFDLLAKTDAKDNARPDAEALACLDATWGSLGWVKLPVVTTFFKSRFCPSIYVRVSLEPTLVSCRFSKKIVEHAT
jgi:hypothetical protein